MEGDGERVSESRFSGRGCPAHCALETGPPHWASPQKVGVEWAAQGGLQWGKEVRKPGQKKEGHQSSHHNCSQKRKFREGVGTCSGYFTLAPCHLHPRPFEVCESWL
jgi:hypothetical protein